MKKLFVLSLVATAVSSALADTANETRLDEIVVTATGFKDSQSNQIKNMTVILGEDIQNKGYRSVTEVLQNAPGINLVHNGFDYIPDLRGQGSNAIKNVKVLVDGVPLNVMDLSHAIMPLDAVLVSNIEKIEIINGGGTVLYGSGTSGGVINIITKKEQQDRLSGGLYYEYASYNTQKYGINAGIKATENLTLNVAAQHKKGDGYRDQDKQDAKNYQIGFNWKLTDKQSLDFRASRYEDDFVNSDGISAETLKTNRRSAGDTVTHGDTVRKEYALTYDLSATDNLHFNLQAYHQKLDRHYRSPTPFAMNMGRATMNGFYTREGVMQEEKNGVNFKGNYIFGNRGNVIFGYEFVKNKLYRTADTSMAMQPAIPGMPTGVLYSSLVDLSKTTHAPFILANYNLNEKLTATAGYRYEHAKYDNYNESTVSYNPKLEKSTSNNSSAYEFGLNYKYSDNGNVYAKYEHGFRTPSPTEMVNRVPRTVMGAVTPRNPTGMTTQYWYEFNDVEKETYNTYEIGTKNVFGNTMLNTAVFYTVKNNEIVNDMPVHGQEWYFTNLQKTRRIGAEIFAEHYFGKLRINESLHYVNAKVTAGEDKGKKIPNVPHAKVRLGVAYDLLDNFTFSTDVNYYSSAVDFYGEKVKSYITTDIGFNYQHSSGLNLKGGVKNLFNEKHEDRAQTVTYVGTSAQSVYRFIPNNERNYYVGIGYNF